MIDNGLLVQMLLVLGGLLAGLLALLVGRLVLRLQGIYLAIATIALVEIVRVAILNLPFATAAGYLLPALALLALAGWFCQRLDAMPLGRAMAAIRDDELAASCMGIDTTRVKLTAFVLSALLAGSTGALAAHFLNTWNARQGTFNARSTTLFNLISGVTPPTDGAVLWCGGAITGQAPHRLNRLGLARTFQNLRLFDGLSVLDNLLVAPPPTNGPNASGWTPPGSCWRSWSWQPWPSVQAGTLAYGNRRRLEMARALATRPQLLLLDEPAARLNPAEKDQLSVLIIEHHVPLLMRLCDRLAVLDFGVRIALTVHQGELVTLLGSNGAGNSTTLRAISALVPASAGQILWRRCPPIAC